MNEKFTSINNKKKERIERISTNRKKDGNGQSKAAIWIIVVLILFSIGAFFLLTRSNESSEDLTEEENETVQDQTVEEDEQQEESSETNEDDITIEDEVDVTDKEDDTDAKSSPLEGDYSKQDQQVGSQSVEEATLIGIQTEGYESFFRVEMDFENGVPLTQAKLSSESNTIQITISGLAEDSSGIAAGTGTEVTGSIVSTVFRNVKGEVGVSYYSIGIKEETSFYLHEVEGENKVVVDIEEKGSEYTSATTEEFTFSQDTQTIEGNASGNVIKIESISYSSQGSSFRIIFRLLSTGEGTIPASTASIVDYEGGKAVKVEISDLYSDFLAPYEAEYGNSAVSGMVGDFANNKSTYYIKLNGGVRDYKLHYLTAPAQLMVDVKV